MANDKKSAVDMTSGNIVSQILLFAFPLLLGQLFQQLYNTFDTWCVGNFVGKNSFSAVGTVGSICNMLVGFAGGFSTGAGVVISQFFGAKDEAKASRTVHTFITFMIVICLLLTVFGVLMVPTMVRFVKSPPEVAVEQRIYLTIYMAGISGLLIYNMGAAIFRAVGNSRLPFIFLVVSATLNIVLDMLFVIAFHWGTAGVAYATILSQGISAILTVIALMKTNSCIRFSVRKLCMDFSLLKKILFIGLPSSIQMAVTSFSNVFVQSYINYFGADVMGGWTAYSKLDQLLFLPMQCLGLASMTFVGQNYGSRQMKRAKTGANTALLLAMAFTAILILPITIFAPSFVTFFISASETEVIKWGSVFLRYLSPFYIICCINQVYGSALRGIGKSQLPMYIMLCTFVFARQLYLFVMANFISNTVLPIAMGYPFGWVLCSTIIVITYFICFNKEEKLHLTNRLADADL